MLTVFPSRKERLPFAIERHKSETFILQKLNLKVFMKNGLGINKNLAGIKTNVMNMNITPSPSEFIIQSERTNQMAIQKSKKMSGTVPLKLRDANDFSSQKRNTIFNSTAIVY